MPPHDYSPRQALQTLLEKLKEFPEIATQVRDAIAQGKEIEILDESQSARRTKKTHPRREKVRLSDDEALIVALGVLRAFFLEIPLFVNTANQEFAEHRGDKRRTEIQIEQVPVTAFNLEAEPEMMTLELIFKAEIEQQKENLNRLEELFRFQGDIYSWQR